MLPDEITPDRTDPPQADETVRAEDAEAVAEITLLSVMTRLDAIDARLSELASSDRAVHADLVESDEDGGETGTEAGTDGPAEPVEETHATEGNSEGARGTVPPARPERP